MSFRRGALLLAFVALGGALILAVEAWLALRREYLPTEDPLELRGSFGPSGMPPLRFVVLGDSTSAGIGVERPADAYPTLLAERLAEEHRRRVELFVVGVSGARVADVLKEQVPKAIDLDPDLVFIGIGANDVTHLTRLSAIRRDMGAALDLLAARTKAAVVVAGAPDMRIAAWHEPLRSLAYLRGKQVTAVIEETARARDMPVVELAEQTGHFFAEDPESHFSQDEFHPGREGYRRWADAIYPVLSRAVRDAAGSE
jgi:lysophospholipase L1-like esterase